MTALPSSKERGTSEYQPYQLPIVVYEGKRWFLDIRLSQIRNIHNPHDYLDLDKDEILDFQYAVLIERLKQQRKSKPKNPESDRCLSTG